jgi:sulfur-oxidizing protein SoxY
MAQLLISHPNANGMQMDQLTRQYTPARFIQAVEVRYGGEVVFDLDADISLSEDPAITFGFLRHGANTLTVEVMDSKQTRFSHSFEVPASGS